MQSDARKNLKTVDITPYLQDLQTVVERLSQSRLAEKTVQSYRGSLIIFFAWCAQYRQCKKVADMNYDDFRDFLSFLDMDRPEPRTINVFIAALKKLVYYALGQRWKSWEIPCRKYNRILPKVPTLEEVQRIVGSCETKEQKALVMLLLSTGIRISEAAALVYSDIRRKDDKIYIRPGKGRSDRFVPLSK